MRSTFLNIHHKEKSAHKCSGNELTANITKQHSTTIGVNSTIGLMLNKV